MAKSSGIPSDEPYLEELWTRFKSGDGDAFDELAQRRYRTLFNYATRFSKDREFIKDCIQDLFLELWDRRQNLMETPYVTIYLLKSLRNNLLRSQKLQRRLGDTQELEEESFDLSDGLTIEMELIASEFVDENERTIRQAIEQLPKRQQEVIFLKYYQGMTNDEIANVMEIERQSVANFLYRAINQLKACFPALIRFLPFPFLSLIF